MKSQQESEHLKFVADRLLRLSPRETQVLQLIVEGMTSKEAGRRLSISHRTVEVYRERIKEMIGARNVMELVRWVTLIQCRSRSSEISDPYHNGQTTRRADGH